MSNKDYLFCSAKNRPPFCFYKTNLCCYKCKRNVECYQKNIDNKIKPCLNDELESDEICSYMI